MMASSVIFIFFFTICGLAAFVNSQVDSCSSNLNINGLPFDPASLHCVNAWSSQNFILRYAQTSSNLWSFVLSAPDANSYIAIGFSSNGLMIGSSAVVGWISATDGSSGVKKYFLGGQSSEEVVPDGGNLVVNTSAIVTQSSRLYLAFQLTADQPSQRIIYALGRTGLMPSSPSFSLDPAHQHGLHSLELCYRSNKQRKPTVKTKEEPWSIKHAWMGYSDDNRSNSGSLFQGMGSCVVLSPCLCTVTGILARRSRCHLRACPRTSSRRRRVYPQRSRDLHSCSWLPSGDGILGSTRQVVEGEEVLELVPPQRGRDSDCTRGSKCLLWNPFS
ncbi:hypothetical protein OIU84_016860 [Salix udensis]|uniref:DOMON domain-containing protein n=1 Tax=Salix udensis TaxID=889485 RepID=A0AAD6JAS2_9ROSI|nr:hypothetical protein OIU84_016860 [Salix udensis]